MVTKGSVLVVDDEINLCRILGAKLAKSGYNVVTVHDGVQAVEKVRESEFDVVLLDLILPKKDGLTALAEIRSTRDSVPVIIMTACENADAVAQARDYGVSAYVNKPFDLDNLVSLVSDISRPGGSKSRKLPDSTVLFGKSQPVLLEIQNGSRCGVYTSTIFDKDDYTVSVTVPENDERFLDLKPRASIKVGLAAADAYYSFITQVLRLSSIPERILVLDKPKVIYRAQRRQFVRKPAAYLVSFTSVIEDADIEQEIRQGKCRDISLDGVCMSVKDELLPGEILSMEIRPKTEIDKIRAIAQVLRCKKDDAGEGHVIGCQFTQVDENLKKLLDS